MMKYDHKEFDDLAWRFLDSDLSDEEFAAFENCLAGSQEARRHYQAIVEIQHGLELCAESNGSADAPPLLFPVEKNKVVRFPWTLSLGAAAAIALGLFFTLNQKPEPLLNAHYAVLRNVDFRGEVIETGQRASTNMMHLMQGAVAIDFPGGTQVVIEGPAWYQIQNDQTLKLSAGTITVDHHGEPGTFNILTPVGQLTEMGTKFGVSVGNGVNDSIVMTEVYEGKVIFDGGKEDALTLSKGEARAIIGNNDQHVVRDSFGNLPIKVEPTFKLSAEANALRATENMASGKAAVTTSFYNTPEVGETFGAQGLTDNRLNDGGSPWDWAFWLAEDEKDAGFTLDLQELRNFSRIDLQNTHNRNFSDRETRRFLIETSVDGLTFTTLIEGNLKSVMGIAEAEFPVETFNFPSTDARYVRFTAFFEKTPDSGENYMGVGLNEIRILE